MKRFLSLFMVFVIICLMIINPLWVGQQEKVRAYTLYESLLMMYPAQFISWYTAQTAQMGMLSQDLAEQLSYLNQNGQIDQYFTGVYSRYQTDVQKIETISGMYFKTLGTFWQDLFTGGNGITGIKEMWTGSTNQASDWYIEPAETQTNYHLIPALKYEGQVTAQTILNLPLTDITDLATKYMLPSLTINNDVYNSAYNYNGNNVTFTKNTIFQANYTFGYTYMRSAGYMPYIDWINVDGSLDSNGNKYRYGLFRMYFHLYWFETPTWGLISDNYIIDSSVSSEEMETIQGITPVSFMDLSSYTLTDAQVTASDYVGTTIPMDYITEMQMLLDHIADASITLENAVIALPQVADLKIETTVPAIRQITGAIAVAEVDIPSFPQVERFKMPTGLSTKFPFSIPWDLKRAFTMFQASAVVPVFVIPFQFPNLNIYESVTIDLTQFSVIAKIMRWFMLATFILGLILATRNLIKG